MATYKDYQPLQPGDLDVHDYRESLTAFASELAALSFTGMGTLTVPGQDARNALQACITHALETDRLVIGPRFRQALGGIEREANARARDYVGSLSDVETPDADTEQQTRARIAVETARYRARLIRRTIIEIVEAHGDRGYREARAAIDALRVFEVAIEDHGDPGEVAAADVAQVALDRIAAGLLIRHNDVPNDERGQPSPDWLAFSLWIGR